MAEGTQAAPVVEARTIDVDDAPVAIRRRGRGRPVLFLHGAGFTGRWLRFHEALTQGADVIAPEHPGFGATPAQEWVQDFDDLVMHYDALRRTLDLGAPFDLVGYSLGGWIAARYATWFPERLRSLVLIVPAGLRVPGKSPAADLFLMSPEQLVTALFEDPTNIGEVFVDLSNVDAAVHAFEEASATAALELRVGAQNDRLVPNEACDRWASLLPNAVLRRIPGTGHALVVEQPEATARAIREFQEALR